MINIVDYTRLDDLRFWNKNEYIEIDGGFRFCVYDLDFRNNFEYLTGYKYTYPKDGSIMLYEYDAPQSGGEKPRNYSSQFLCSGDMMDNKTMNNGIHEIFFIIMTEDLKMLNVLYNG